jgi:hypothetical protein
VRSEDEGQAGYEAMRRRGVRGVGFALRLVVGLTGGRNTIRLERWDIRAHAVGVQILRRDAAREMVAALSLRLDA